MSEAFKVYTLEELDESKNLYSHWATNLTMIIIKNGVEIILTSEEIKELVKTLPRTVGGSY